MKKTRMTMRIPLMFLWILLGLATCSFPGRRSTEEDGTKDAAKTTTAAGEETTLAPTTKEAIPLARQLENRWRDGDLSDLAGLYMPQAADPEEAARRQAVLDDFAVFEEAESDPAEEKGLLSLLQPFIRLDLPDIPDDAAFPQDIQVTVVTPDLAQILKDLGFEKYEDPGELMRDLEAVLQKGQYPERTNTLTLTLQKDGDTVYAEPNREALFAFYGGMAELYTEEYMKYLEEIGNDLGGQEP